jgi:hypothetical protein
MVYKVLLTLCLISRGSFAADDGASVASQRALDHNGPTPFIMLLAVRNALIKNINREPSYTDGFKLKMTVTEKRTAPVYQQQFIKELSAIQAKKNSATGVCKFKGVRLFESEINDSEHGFEMVIGTLTYPENDLEYNSKMLEDRSDSPFRLQRVYGGPRLEGTGAIYQRANQFYPEDLTKLRDANRVTIRFELDQPDLNMQYQLKMSEVAQLTPHAVKYRLDAKTAVLGEPEVSVTYPEVRSTCPGLPILPVLVTIPAVAPAAAPDGEPGCCAIQ